MNACPVICLPFKNISSERAGIVSLANHVCHQHLASYLELIIYFIQLLNEWTNEWMPGAGNMKMKNTQASPQSFSVSRSRENLAKKRPLQWMLWAECSGWQRRGPTWWGVWWEAWWTKGHLSYDTKYHQSESYRKGILGIRNHMWTHTKTPKSVVELVEIYSGCGVVRK